MAKILAPHPHFFKVVVFPADLGLKLPDAFTRKYRHELQESVFLTVANGVCWQVELVHYENGCSLLQKGWKEFAEFYSIKIYHFLVFQYKRDSRFHVLIFDPTASEIDYPSSSSSNSGENRSANLCVEPDIGPEVEQGEIVEVEVEVHHQTVQIWEGKSKQMVETRTYPRTRRGKKLPKLKPSKDMSFTKQTKAKIYREKFKLHEAKSSRPFFISFMQHFNVLQSSCRLVIYITIFSFIYIYIYTCICNDMILDSLEGNTKEISQGTPLH